VQRQHLQVGLDIDQHGRIYKLGKPKFPKIKQHLMHGRLDMTFHLHAINQFRDAA
jgi:hypothetical protein